LKDLETKIVPFFLEYPFQGSKFLNFQDFNKVIEIMKVKGHLKEGLELIKDIKAGMNTGRK
jgi:hypothetical protein